MSIQDTANYSYMLNMYNIYIYFPSSFFKPTLDYNSNHKIFNFVTYTHVLMIYCL